MNTEQQIIIQILRDFIAKQATVIDQPFGCEKLIAYAKSQQVSGILYWQCRHLLDPTLPAVRSLVQQNAMELYYHANRTQILADIDRSFRRSGIPYIIVKGVEIAALYPVPALRSMGDADIVVHPEDMKQADAALRELGFRLEYGYWKNGFEVELHDCLMEYEGDNAPAYYAYFNDFWQYVEGGKLRWEFHFLYLVSHLRKHIMSAGVGLRQFMDLAIVADYMRESADWGWIEQELQKVNLLDFARTCLAFCRRWFGLDSPIAPAAISDEFFLQATRKIFLDGVFGHDNEDNKVTKLAKTAYHNRGNGVLSKLKFVIGYAFPSYESLRSVSYYSFVNGRKYLLPLAWGYRIVRVLTGKVEGRRRLAAVRESLSSDELVQQRLDYLTEWRV